MDRKDYLVLVNKENKIPDNWEEIIELVEVKNSFGKIFKIEKETLEKFNKLRTDLLNEGIDIELDSVYRSRNLKKNMEKNMLLNMPHLQVILSIIHD